MEISTELLVGEKREHRVALGSFSKRRKGMIFVHSREERAMRKRPEGSL